MAGFPFKTFGIIPKLLNKIAVYEWKNNGVDSRPLPNVSCPMCSKFQLLEIPNTTAAVRIGHGTGALG